MTDTTILLMLALKNGWTLSGSGMTANDIVFTTNWYNEMIVMPQVTVTMRDSRENPVETGMFPIYLIVDDYAVDTWVRPSGDSNTSYGAAKNMNYLMRRECKKIIKNIGVFTGDNGQEWVTSRGWRTLNETKTRPVLFRTNIIVRTYKYRDINTS